MDLYNAAWLFAIPSLQDNLPNTIIEAMLCGTPVVGFNTGGIPEMIDHKVNGYLAEYKSANDLAKGVEWVLSAMAYISPQTDYHPEIAKAVNTDAIINIIQVIEAQPGGAERIKFIYTGTVAETGNRPKGIHVGRVGDPLKPSVFDFYAVTKIAGERAVLELVVAELAQLLSARAEGAVAEPSHSTAPCKVSRRTSKSSEYFVSSVKATPMPGGSCSTRTTLPVPSMVSTSSMMTVKVSSMLSFAPR